MERTEHILIRVSPSEKESIRGKAGEAGLSMSEFIRRSVNTSENSVNTEKGADVNTRESEDQDSVNTQGGKSDEKAEINVNTCLPKEVDCSMYVSDSETCGKYGKSVWRVTNCGGPY